MMNKKKILTSVLILILLSISFIRVYFYIIKKLDIKDITLKEFDSTNKTITIEIMGKSYKNFNCIIKNSYNEYNIDSSNNKCSITLPINEDYKIYLENKSNKTEDVYLTDYINNVLSFELLDETIYMAIDEEIDLNYSSIYIDSNKANYSFKVDDESIAVIKDNKITALNKGETTIKNNAVNKEIKLVVTDLISKANYKEKKEDLTCNRYTKEESELLDNILSYKINYAGYKTRGAAVAAARFLTLEFNYRVPYFYENGRVSDSGVHLADGEGRYYKTGLYLHEDKFKDITVSYKGPAIWGCPLLNLENDPKYGYYVGQMHANGLDCSGFVSWALKNAGFDPGDNGAGENEEIPNQMTDLGEFVPLTSTLLESGKVKVGDLINFWGHIGMIIGIDNEGNYYVAESLQNYYGVVARKYTKSSLLNMFEFVVLMDEYYIEDGKYTNWI